MVYWRAYITGEHKLVNGDRLLRPNWKWYLQALGSLPQIPERYPTSLIVWRVRGSEQPRPPSEPPALSE